MNIWPQTSLFTYHRDQPLDDIVQSLKLFGEPTPYFQVKKLLKKYSVEGDLILDPCCGHGTTGIAALELNRQAILNDLNPSACKVTRALFEFFDEKQAISLWREIKANLDKLTTSLIIDLEVQKNWGHFVNHSLPQFAAYKRILNKKIIKIAQIYHPEDLHSLKNIFFQIAKISDGSTKELFEVVFSSVLIESSQLAISQNQKSYYLPKHQKKKHPEKLFPTRLELFLRSQCLIKNKIRKNFMRTPNVVNYSACTLTNQKSSSIDYAIIHLPGIIDYSEGEMSYLIESLLGQYTDRQNEIMINLDYQGRQRLNRQLSRLFKEMKRVLKDNGHLSLLFASQQVLLTIIMQIAGREGWQVLQENVEIIRYRPDYQLISLTLSQKTQHTVLGALNKMKIETLYDTEEAVLRKIDHFLSKHNTATFEEIQSFLIKNHLFDCLISRSLKKILAENFLPCGKYWIRPTCDQKRGLFQKRRQIMKKFFPDFVREMTNRFLLEKNQPISYQRLLDKFFRLKPRMIFDTPYFHLLMEECESTEIKLDKLITQYFNAVQKDQFETLVDVLKRLIRVDSSFFNFSKDLIGLASWSTNDYFKIYFELFEKAKRKMDYKSQGKLAKKAIEILPEVDYLNERKKKKIREYLLRSES